MLNTQLQHLIAKVAFLMTYVYNDYFLKVVFLCHSIKYTDFKPVNDAIILIGKKKCCKSCPRSVYNIIKCVTWEQSFRLFTKSVVQLAGF